MNLAIDGHGGTGIDFQVHVVKNRILEDGDGAEPHLLVHRGREVVGGVLRGGGGSDIPDLAPAIQAVVTGRQCRPAFGPDGGDAGGVGRAVGVAEQERPGPAALAGKIGRGGIGRGRIERLIVEVAHHRGQHGFRGRLRRRLALVEQVVARGDVGIGADPAHQAGIGHQHDGQKNHRDEQRKAGLAAAGEGCGYSHKQRVIF